MVYLYIPDFQKSKDYNQKTIILKYKGKYRKWNGTWTDRIKKGRGQVGLSHFEIKIDQI